jgi:LacI family transcriptional regulator
LRNPHFCEYATGVEQEARAAGYHVLLSSTTLNDDYANDIFRDMARRRIDGLILASSFILESPDAQATLAQVRQRGLPVVEFDDLYGVDSVYSDYRVATQEVMTYLLGLGHRRIGMVYGVGGHELAEDRLKSYAAGLQAAGLPVEESLILRCGPTIEDGYQAARQLLQLPKRPTALVVINDLLAIGAARAAADLGLQIPKDLSLVSYDDIPAANYLVPRLTTVTKDALGMGRTAFKMLLTRIQEPSLPRQQSYSPARLIIRESTGPVPT